MITVTVTMKSVAKNNTLVISADEIAKARQHSVMRAMMGSDFRSHSGARSQIQRNKKREERNQKWKGDW